MDIYGGLRPKLYERDDGSLFPGMSLHTLDKCFANVQRHDPCTDAKFRRCARLGYRAETCVPRLLVSFRHTTIVRTWKGSGEVCWTNVHAARTATSSLALPARRHNARCAGAQTWQQQQQGWVQTLDAAVLGTNSTPARSDDARLTARKWARGGDRHIFVFFGAKGRSLADCLI